LHIFRWKTLERETPPEGITLILPPSLTNISLSNDWHSRPGLNTLHQTLEIPNTTMTGFVTLDLSQISSSSPLPTQIDVSIIQRHLVSRIKAVLGIHRSSIFVLSSRGWVYSLGVKALGSAKSYTRHFFIPSVWQTGGETLARVVSKRNTVVFAYRDELAVFQGFLDFEAKTFFEEVVVGEREVTEDDEGSDQ
jgi:hypothetical protein